MLYLTKQQKGVSLYLTVVILSAISAALLLLISISISQIKIVWRLSDSINAYYAADTGIERALFRIRKQDNYDNFSGTIEGASYTVTISFDGSDTVIRSVGSYKHTKRAIETRY